MRTAKEEFERVVQEVVAPHAEQVDRSGTFPREGITALAAAGVLGLTAPDEIGGGGGTVSDAAAVVRRLGEVCGSTAMIMVMHYSAAAVLLALGPADVRRDIAHGRHLTTLAFSERGSRSHFWASLGSARESGEGVRLDGEKSWVTSAVDADSYVWSSKPLVTPGPQTLWMVPSDTPGLQRGTSFDGVGLRGNGSVPITAQGAVIARSAMLGEDGAGLDNALTLALPWFLALSAAFSTGIMESVTSETRNHLVSTRLEHIDQSLIEQPLTRHELARMRVLTDLHRLLVEDAITAAVTGREDALLRLFEAKAATADAAADVADTAMKVCGGSAFRKELGIERRFRDSLAARVMAPTSDALFDFIGRLLAGLPLLET